jgi:hypothetical protein
MKIKRLPREHRWVMIDSCFYHIKKHSKDKRLPVTIGLYAGCFVIATTYAAYKYLDTNPIFIGYTEGFFMVFFVIMILPFLFYWYYSEQCHRCFLESILPDDGDCYHQAREILFRYY